MPTTIKSIEAWLCVLPLNEPIDLGNFFVRARNHLAIRIRTNDGLIADCITQTRGSPLDVVVTEVFAPRLIGKCPFGLSQLKRELELELTALEFDGAIGRAWSAIEICLQDLRAQVCEVPLWKMFGGRAREVEVELVEGYGLKDETDIAFVERLLSRVKAGFRRLKIEGSHYRDPTKLYRHLRDFRVAAGPDPRLILDFAWSWPNAKDKQALVEGLAEFDIDWIEDPFPRTALKDFKKLKELTAIPVGSGDEATRAADLQALLDADAIDVLRIDATTIGGYDVARVLAENARTSRVRVSFHEHPEVHHHCVLGWSSSDHLEIFPSDRPFDRVHDLLIDPPFTRIVRGKIPAPEGSGTGIQLNDNGLLEFAARYTKAG